jgi:hypothetical protein
MKTAQNGKTSKRRKETKKDREAIDKNFSQINWEKKTKPNKEK